MDSPLPRRRLPLLLALAGLPPLVLVFAFTGCSPARDPWLAAKPGQKRVLASFPPLYCFTANVAGEHAKVLCLSTATGPHDYKPTHTDALKVAGADLYLHNGLQLDDDASARLLQMSRKGTVRPIKVGDEIPHDLLEHNHEDEPADPKDKGHHHHGDHDPHVWLGLEQARAMVDVIATELTKLDAEHKADFEKNAIAYKKELAELESYGKKQFAGVKNRSIITMHESLGYFAKTFDLKIAGFLLEQAAHGPEAAGLARLIEKGKKDNVRVIAREPQFGRGAADELATALKPHLGAVDIIEIDPVETADTVDGSNPSPGFYIERMRRNIDELARALKQTSP